jgi:hypothetical protein
MSCLSMSACEGRHNVHLASSFIFLYLIPFSCGRPQHFCHVPSNPSHHRPLSLVSTFLYWLSVRSSSFITPILSSFHLFFFLFLFLKKQILLFNNKSFKIIKILFGYGPGPHQPFFFSFFLLFIL